MATLLFSDRFVADHNRIEGHLRQHEVADLDERMAAIFQGLGVLEQSPLIGRPIHSGLRELVIGRRNRGYVVLYLYDEEPDTVSVLGIRGQKEAGYSK